MEVSDVSDVSVDVSVEVSDVSVDVSSVDV